MTFSLLFILKSTFGQRLPKLTKKTLTKIRTDQSLDHFYANVACKCEGLLGEPTLPRKRRTLARLEVGAGAPSYPQVLFSCPRPLNRVVCLIKVSFKVNKGNNFGDFGYCPLNRGCPLNTVSA